MRALLVAAVLLAGRSEECEPSVQERPMAGDSAAAEVQSTRATLTRVAGFGVGAGLMRYDDSTRQVSCWVYVDKGGVSCLRMLPLR